MTQHSYQMEIFLSITIICFGILRLIPFKFPMSRLNVTTSRYIYTPLSTLQFFYHHSHSHSDRSLALSSPHLVTQWGYYTQYSLLQNFTGDTENHLTYANLTAGLSSLFFPFNISVEYISHSSKNDPSSQKRVYYWLYESNPGQVPSLPPSYLVYNEELSPLQVERQIDDTATCPIGFQFSQFYASKYVFELKFDSGLAPRFA